MGSLERDPEQATSEFVKRVPHPIEKCSLLSFATVSWVFPLLKLGAKNPLEVTDVYDLPVSMSASTVGAAFTRAFEASRGKRRIVRALWKVFGKYYLRALCIVPFLTGVQAMLPLALKALIRVVNDENAYVTDPFLGIKSGWGIAGLLCVCTTGMTMFMNSIFLNMTLLGCNTRTALMESLYRKIVLLSEASLQEASLGQIVTLVSADLERIFLGALQSILLVSGSLLIIVLFALFIFEVGIYATLGGFAVIFLSLPLNTTIARSVGKRKRAMLEVTDARVRFMTDILKGIRIVKLNAWENSVEQHVQTLRDKETSENGTCIRLMLLTQSIAFTIPAIMPFFMFLTYIALGNELSVDKVFAVLALNNMIRMPMQMLPRAANGVMQALVSLSRIENFLLIPARSLGWESLCSLDQTSEAVSVAQADVELDMVSCSWGGEAEKEALKKLAATAPKGKGKGKGKGKETSALEPKGAQVSGASEDDGAKGKSAGANKGISAGEHDAAVKCDTARSKDQSAQLVLSGVTLKIQRGQKVAVVGRVASGKSSLLSSILGELEVKDGTIARSCAVVPYCRQSPWIQSSTVKNNVLFGLPHIPEFYDRAIEAAQLKQDLRILPDSDDTSIGENGINLSGGQKARIALARAFYSALHSNPPLLLLDDPIAAVDAFVAHAIFKEGFLDLLRDKTVVLTLNAHLDLLSSFDRVIVLADGKIAADGTLVDVMKTVPWIRDAVGAVTHQEHEVKKSTEAKEEKPKVATQGEKIIDKPRNAARPLYEPEDRVTGRVQVQNYVEWAKCAVSGSSRFAGASVLGMILALFATTQAIRISLDVWVATWAKNNEDTTTGIAVYGLLALGFLLNITLRAVAFVVVSMRSCRAVHHMVLSRVLHAPINLFYDVTPSGRILNRFSGDLEKIDDKLPEQLYNFLNLLTTIVGSIAVCTVSSPFVICGIPFIGYLFKLIVSFYQKSARELKRLDAISRSPLLQHLSESMQGLSTLRAYNAVPRFSEKYTYFVNNQSKVFFAFWMSSRWLAMRVDACAALLQCLVALISIAWKDNVDPVIVGVALVWGFQLSGMLQFCVRSFAEVENTMTGMERLVAYKHVPQEASHVCNPQLADTWPTGEIELRNVCARYRPELPLVLKNVSLRISPGERVGICGRTGSGKSTMGLLLFRIVEIESGSIFFDGQDTRQIGLTDLRERICMIPQDPIIFRMTVRDNLDPFHSHTDEDIWRCLQLVCMDQAIRALAGELYFLCAEGGANFSLGQLQLLCIARALLRKPGIVMMDEATANVDSASDEIIQRTIRSHFVNVTVLTIAHRLSTIADSSKIAVFEKGEVIEFGAPHDLVRNKGALAAMFQEAGVVLPFSKGEDVVHL
eukprot:TRINITY_DN23293_c0_g1_i1.p1 TRINITY_DN23293_c0_g1~~TRINITY_DN23293_c0_g1_i1.p1  ORF type:complete len:1367 (-),score=172.97 TRINITY_DN23293_c0_g1_i1:180-4280(-)